MFSSLIAKLFAIIGTERSQITREIQGVMTVSWRVQ